MTLLDRLLASKAERMDADHRAGEAIRRHGSRAVETLRAQLVDMRRATSHRAIKLAIRTVKRRLAG